MEQQTIQRCYMCDLPTGLCEEDSIYLPSMNPDADGLGPLCEDCCEAVLNDAKQAQAK